MAKGLQGKNTVAVPGIKPEDSSEFIEDFALLAAGVVELPDVLDKYSIDELTIKQAAEDPSVKIAVKKKRAQLISDGSIMRKTALRAMDKNKDQLDAFLNSDLNASSHATIASLCYKLSGLKAKDKRSEKNNYKSSHTIVLNIGRSKNREPIVVSGTAQRDDRQEAEVIEGIDNAE